MPRILTETDQIVGSRIRTRRKQLAMSERQLASLLNVSLDEIEAFENGATRIGAIRLAQTAKALDTPIAYFFAVASAAKFSVPRAHVEQSPRWAPGASELVSAYSRLESSQLRGAVQRLVGHLAGESQAAVPQILAKAASKVRRSKSQAH